MHIQFNASFTSLHIQFNALFNIQCIFNSMVDQLVCLPFTRRNRKFRLENQMVRVIPFGKAQKLWAAGWGDAYFLFFLISLAALATL